MADNVMEFIVVVRQVGTEALTKIKKEVEELKASASKTTEGTEKLEKSLEKTSKSAQKASKSSEKLQKSLSSVGKKSKKAKSDVEKLNEEIKKLKEGIKAVIGAWGAFEIGKHITEIAGEFEQYRVQLETILGSSQKAKEAFEWVKNFAKETPYQLSQIMEAFVKLNAYGIDATKTLKILGDTASSMGKGLDQAVEALADAMTGEFERLKEFGIKTKATAEEVTFTWVQNGQQMTKTVKNMGTEIEKALLEIWGQRFKDGMKKQMNTLNGIISNFLDNLTNAANEFMEKSGLLKALEGFLKKVNNSLSNLFKSKDFRKFAEELGTSIRDIAETIGDIWKTLKPIISETFNLFKGILPEIVKFVFYLKAVSLASRLAAAGINSLVVSVRRFKTAIALAKLPIGEAVAALGRLRLAISVLGAALVGWEIGTWLRQFKFFRWLGMEIVGILLRIKYYALAAFRAMTFDFSGAKEALKELDKALKLNREAYEQQEKEIEKKNKEAQKSITIQNQEAQAASKVAQETQKIANEEQRLNQLREEGLKLEEELKKAVEEQRRLKEKLKKIEEDRVSFVQNVENTIADIRRSKLSESLRYADMYDEAWKNIYRMQSALQEKNFQKAELLYDRTKKLLEALKKSNTTIPQSSINQLTENLQKLYEKFAGKSAFNYVAEAEKEVQKKNYEEAKQYLIKAKQLFEDMARSYDTLTSEKGFKGLELVKQKYEEIAKLEKEQVEKNLDGVQKKIEALKEALTEVTKQYKELADKDITVTIDSNINEIINYWENIRDKTITLTIKKQEVEAHRTGGIVGVVPGGWGGGDKVHALLEPGEFVIRKEAVARFGAGFFHALNSLKLPKLPVAAKSIAEKAYKKFVINIAGAEIEGFSTKEALAEFERQLRRKKLRLA